MKMRGPEEAEMRMAAMPVRLRKYAGEQTIDATAKNFHKSPS
jgi:hypothetical protein